MRTLQCLAQEQIPQTLVKLFDKEAPEAAKQMAAKGLLPAPPEDLVKIYYHFHITDPENLGKVAAETLRSYPSALRDDILKKTEIADICHYLANVFLKDDEALEILLSNVALDDQTLEYLASEGSKKLTSMIAEFHTRLLRYPQIIEALYNNRNTRMAIVDKLLDLAQRNGVSLPNLQFVQNAFAGADYVKSEGETTFDAIVQEKREDADDAKIRKLADILDGEEQAQSTEEVEDTRRAKDILMMNPAEKMRLAILGSRSDRTVLLRDPKRMVYMAAIQSPKISIAEIENCAGSKSMPDDMIQYIANKREWIRYYPVMLALTQNPKCPLPQAIAFLKQLRANDLKIIQRSKNIPAQLAKQAQFLYRQRSAGSQQGAK